MSEFETHVMSLRKAAMSWKEIRDKLQSEVNGNGSKLQLLADIEAKEGRKLKKFPRDELYAAIAEELKSNPSLKPMALRDRIWDRGIDCYRQDISSFKSQLDRTGTLDSFIKHAEIIQADKAEPDLFPIADYRILSEIMNRHGKQKILRVIRDAF